MLKKIIVTVLFILVSLSGIAQKSINNYKYIIIPKKFEFSKSENQYQLNALTKFLFNKYGYEAYYTDDLPKELINDPCKGLKVAVSKEKSSMFKTKLEIILKDCYDATVMTSKTGESRIKEYDKAHNEALRDAFKTYQDFDYKYSSEEKMEEPIGQPEVTITDSKPDEERVEEETVKPAIAKVVKQEKENDIKVEKPNKTEQELFYAQEIVNGFQLVNAEPRVVMVLLKTAAENIFIVKGKSAIVFNKDGNWLYSENNGVNTTEKLLNIKF